jgi:hypothetical protein
VAKPFPSPASAARANQPVAAVLFMLGPDGRVRVQIQGEVDRSLFNAIVETGRQDALARYAALEAEAREKAKDGPPIQAAPPGFAKAVGLDAPPG